MARVKRGVQARRRHKKILKQAKGYYGARSRVFRVAVQAVTKAGQYAYRDRKVRKRQFRRLWIVRINAAARLNGLSYSRAIRQPLALWPKKPKRVSPPDYCFVLDKTAYSTGEELALFPRFCLKKDQRQATSCKLQHDSSMQPHENAFPVPQCVGAAQVVVGWQGSEPRCSL